MPKRRRANSKQKRDIEKSYPVTQFIAKLRRWAQALESGGRFVIQVQNERIYVPAHAVVNIEHERDDTNEEVEFQIKWSNAPDTRSSKTRSPARSRSQSRRTPTARRAASSQRRRVTTRPRKSRGGRRRDR